MKKQSIIISVILTLIFVSCKGKKDSKIENEAYFLEQGKNFAMQAQKVLAMNLISEITENGTVDAISFCSEKAYPLTDSMAQSLNVQLRRVSDKPRNQNNKANKKELKYIEEAKVNLGSGIEVKPLVSEIAGKIVAYYPIIANQLCMQCHGTIESDIAPETQSQLEKLYPDDKGTGYKPNELRGIWVVEMDKK